ncbi:MAG: hypothetical protein NTW96_01465 [Planctomycetia bacterium]|nr:hypothetical protein [Planctomycetia bacterium]
MNLNPLRWSWKRRIVLFALLMVCLFGAYRAYGIFRWKTYIWVPSYLASTNPDTEIPDDQKHLIFIMVDHYEHGGPQNHERGTLKNGRWLKDFRAIASKHFDSFGNSFRYTWFYPYDHKNEQILIALCRMAYDGFGEVELHWHIPKGTTAEEFPSMLKECIAWFQQYGALISSGETPRTAFAYVAGSWNLDSSRPGWDTVTNQIDILHSQGCYADFTFSTIGTVSQPSKVNSIYYVTDTDAPKSYDTGIDAQVGHPVNDRMMIFEGPLCYNWLTGSLEYGAVESDPDLFPSPSRIERWIDANIHVKGRPEWVFVKVYSHGAQSQEAILRGQLDPMLTCIEGICKERGISLHYMTVREAYNVVKAAEDGKTGNPEDYRDYRIPKPCNMLFHTEVPVAIERVTESESRCTPIDGENTSKVEKVGP